MTTRKGDAKRAFGGAAIAATLIALGGTALLAGLAPRPAQAAPLTEEQIKEAKAIADLGAVLARAGKGDYERAKWDPIHFKPAIDYAKDEACLVCHKEITTAKPRAASPAGVKATQVEAWYQTLDTYAGAQEDFHWRHLQSPYAKQVMTLSCNFCHQGNDSREESPHVLTPAAANSDWAKGAPNFTLRKMVNPSETCLRCHGSYPGEIMGLPPKWEETREALESPEAPNGCLTCHAEQFRLNRHAVTYLHGQKIEELAKTSSDVCYGCHGGRQWYRISYPYPRHPWQGMPDETPDWAKDRAKESDARFALPKK